jgi:coenzyme PQQ biosynthesis protein PqqD
MATTRRISSAGRGVSPPTDLSRPRLRPGCRISDAPGQDATLMIPEGALRLNPTGVNILRLCDGKTFREILAELQRGFPLSAASQIEQDTSTFLDRLHDRRVLDYE